LYDEFYYNLMEDHLNNDIVIYFPEESNELMEKLVNSVNWKHLCCNEHKPVPSIKIKSNKNPKLEEDVGDNNSKTETFESNLKLIADGTDKFNKSNDVKESNSETHELADENLECPSNDDLFTTRIPDEMFAHICMNHKKEKSGRPSLQVPSNAFLLKNLVERISKKCFLCKNINFEYRDHQNLREHYHNFHAAEREYVICSHCDKKMLKRTLKLHLNNLNSEKRSCEICNKMYTPVNLVRHKSAVHADRVAVQCPTCEKVFYWSENKKERLLKEHMQSVHERYRPFVCEICGKKMAKFTNLDDHRINIHGSKKMSIGAYREMIESGNYEFLNGLPTNLD